jgi:hypothetical protein
VEKRPWYERLFDRDNPVAPFLVLGLLVLAIVLVMVLAPILQRSIEGEPPASHQASPRAALLAQAWSH